MCVWDRWSCVFLVWATEPAMVWKCLLWSNSVHSATTWDSKIADLTASVPEAQLGSTSLQLSWLGMQLRLTASVRVRVTQLIACHARHSSDCSSCLATPATAACYVSILSRHLENRDKTLQRPNIDTAWATLATSSTEWNVRNASVDSPFVTYMDTTI